MSSWKISLSTRTPKHTVICNLAEIFWMPETMEEGDYGAWYAFGRSQAIADSGLKLLFPYMSDLPHFVYMPQKDMMIYCGYAIYSESETELLFLKRVLESSVFNYYMKHTSKPYSTGYYSYAKNYVKSFGIYPFSEEQKNIYCL